MVQHWCRLGWSITVATEAIELWNSTGHGKIFEGIADPCPVWRIPLRKKYNVIESLGELFLETKERAFEREIVRRASGDTLQPFDLLVAFSYRSFPLGTAARLSQRWGIPVVMDCRDIVEQYAHEEFLPTFKAGNSCIKRLLLRQMRQQAIRQRTHFLKQSSAITTVSPWHKELLAAKHPDKEVALFYNGFDRKLFAPRPPLSTPIFRILFTGRLLSLQRANPQPLFEALASPQFLPLCQEGKLEVVWYVDEHSKLLLREALQNSPKAVQGVQHIKSMVPFTEVPQRLGESSLVLLLASPETADGAHGIVSTKIFEAMAVGRPQLMILGDKGIAETLLTQAHTGKVAHSVKEVIQHLEYYYQEWVQQGYTTLQGANIDYITNFARDEIAQQYSCLLQQLVANSKNNKTTE